jgi:hypothetical protein
MTDGLKLTWTSPSANSEGSMPLGGCGIGLNVWFENQDLFIYFQRSGTFDEHNGFPKLGRLRISQKKSSWSDLQDFTQTLNSEIGTIQISFKDSELTNHTLLIWVNTFEPVFHIEHTSSLPVELIVAYENWRYLDRTSPAEDENSYIFGERNDIFGYWMYPKDLIRRKDLLELDDNHICWHHQNNNDDLAFDKEMDQQGFQDYKEDLYNPLKDLVFGGMVEGEGLVKLDETYGDYLMMPYKALRLTSASPSVSTRINVFCHTEQVSDLSYWRENLKQVINQYHSEDYTEKKEKTHLWWQNFWKRSLITIDPHEADELINKEVRQVSDNYRWFRFIQGFNHKGDFPLKFNGGLLTYDSCLVNYIEDKRDVSFVKAIEAEKDRLSGQVNEVEANENLRLVRNFGPDYRAWGGGSITPQNQRLLYWPLLKSGDFDLFKPQFQWYQDTLKTTELRSEIAYGHQGCSYTEQINNFGLPIGSHFGWKRPDNMGLGQLINRSCDDHYSTQLEFAYMMLEYHRYFGLSINHLIPFIESSAEFFFAHFEKVALDEKREAYDENGHLIIYPSSALESYKKAKNPNDVTCGLRAIYRALISIDKLEDKKRTLYQKRLDQIPPLISRDYKGHKTIAPAYAWAEINNVELPQMYPVYPYQEYGVGLKDLQIAIDTWEHSCNEIYGQRSYASWHQDGIFCAHLGLINEAKEVLICKLADGGRRFPAFWGPGHDWSPDHNWGGTGMIQLQEMLLQDKNGELFLLPCWPEHWDVSFKLRAGSNTVVECEVKNGNVKKLIITPPERANDIKQVFGKAFDQNTIRSA